MNPLTNPRTFALAAIICLAFGVVTGWAFALMLSRVTVTYVVYGSAPFYEKRVFTTQLEFIRGLGIMLIFFIVSGIGGILPHTQTFQDTVSYLTGQKDEDAV